MFKIIKTSTYKELQSNTYQLWLYKTAAEYHMERSVKLEKLIEELDKELHTHTAKKIPIKKSKNK